MYNASNNELVRGRSHPCMQHLYSAACCSLRTTAGGHPLTRVLRPARVLQVRTQTLVKSAIIQVDATPFKQFYQQHYGVEVCHGPHPFLCRTCCSPHNIQSLLRNQHPLSMWFAPHAAVRSGVLRTRALRTGRGLDGCAVGAPRRSA